MQSQVETYSGFRLHERPRRFTWGEEWLQVRTVLKGWRSPEHLYFKVVAGDERTFLLSYHEVSDTWEAELAPEE
jgi:hypothetical protein